MYDDADDGGMVARFSYALVSDVCHACFAQLVCTCILCVPRCSIPWAVAPLFVCAGSPIFCFFSMYQSQREYPRSRPRMFQGCILKMSQLPVAREPRSTSSTRSLKIPRKWWWLDDVGRDIWVWDVSC